jgi:5-(carboxyamino)imidazole ribonucleotide synthase
MQQDNLGLAILGGGQLAQMLAQASAPMGYPAEILSQNQNDPARLVTAFWSQGNPQNKSDLKDFLKHKKLLTFESEFIDADALIEIERESKLFIFPRPHLMKLLQYRSSQKIALLQFGLPTADFMSVRNHVDLNKAWEKFNGNFVLKKAFGGYDGYGTYFVRNAKEFAKANAVLSGEIFIAEPFVHFKRELATVICRSQNGSIVCLPLVQSHQISHRCDWVTGPEHHREFAKLQKKIFKMLTTLNYVGCIAFEFFDTGKNLFINEVAPRVHNSGHYSQEALLHSQFDLHVMAGLGLELPKPQLKTKAFVMTNLIGKSQKPIAVPKGLSGKLHMYSKAENRPGRKMGHVNYIGESKSRLLNIALKERKKFSL